MRFVLFALAFAAGAASFLELVRVSFIEQAIPGVILGIAAAQFLAMALTPSGLPRRLGQGTIGYRDFTAYSDGSVVVKYDASGRIAYPSLEFAERIAREQAVAQGASTDIPISYEGFGRKP